MTPNELIQQCTSHTEDIEFSDVIECIDTHYIFTPCAFTNGSTCNEAGTNQGSAKIFAFAQKHALDKTQTLALFGRYYREDVLQHPKENDHANIRNFMLHGWDQMKFEGNALA